MQLFLSSSGGRPRGGCRAFDRGPLRRQLAVVVLLKGFDKFLGAQGSPVQGTSQVRRAGVGPGEGRTPGRLPSVMAGRWEYLESSSISKEQVAREIAQRDGITKGLVCVLSCVSRVDYSVRNNRRTKLLEVVPARRKCLCLYFTFWIASSV